MRWRLISIGSFAITVSVVASFVLDWCDLVDHDWSWDEGVRSCRRCRRESGRLSP